MVPEPGNRPRNKVCRTLVRPVFTIFSSATKPSSLLKMLFPPCFTTEGCRFCRFFLSLKKSHDRSQASSPDKQKGGDFVHTWQCNAARGFLKSYLQMCAITFPLLETVDATSLSSCDKDAKMQIRLLSSLGLNLLTQHRGTNPRLQAACFSAAFSVQEGARAQVIPACSHQTLQLHQVRTPSHTLYILQRCNQRCICQ